MERGQHSKYAPFVNDELEPPISLSEHLSLLKPWMISRQRIAQQLIRNVRIDFRRAHAGVAEHLLDSKQVGAAFQ